MAEGTTELSTINSNLKLTRVERQALESGRQLLGNNLADFLLSGLGETKITRRRVFTAQSTTEQGDEITYQIEMINDSALGLPIGRDPLVMAVLLDLLHKGMRMDDCVDFSAGDILNALGWPQPPESRLLTTQAVERYSATNFCLIEGAAPDEEPRSHFQRLLISYETVSKSLSAKASARQLLMKVQFFRAFIYHIFTRRKSFLGIQFELLRLMKEIPG